MNTENKPRTKVWASRSKRKAEAARAPESTAFPRRWLAEQLPLPFGPARRATTSTPDVKAAA